jgi:putative oxidoreductase
MFKKLFAPANESSSANCALLVLRLWLGLTILLNHGWGKLSKFQSMSGSFADPLGIGHTASLSLAVFAEVVAALLLILGLFTRFGALVLSINMAVAFIKVHHLALKGDHSGELAFIYLAGFIAILLAGPGRFSLDSKVFAAKAAPAKSKPDRK